MSTLSIKAVSTKRDEKQFLELPWQLHRDDPCWTPPLRTNQAELAGFRSHPFYRDAECRTFLAVLDGKVSGRISAIHNCAYDRTHPSEQIGFLGFFRSINEQKVADALFNAAADWLRERGRTAMRGPVNPSMNYECGLLVQNFSAPATFMMTYNPEYYPQLWEAFGFAGVQDLYSFRGHKRALKTLEDKVAFIAEEAKQRFKIHMRPMRKTRFLQEVKTFLSLYNSSLRGTWGYVPMSDAEIHITSKHLKHLIVPELTMLAEVDGKPIGAVFGLPDYNPRIKIIDGRLFPFGFIRLLSNRRGIKKLRLISANVIPEYQRWGIGVVLVHSLLAPGLRWGIEEAEFSWVLESNHLSLKSLQRAKIHMDKLHRLFQMPL